MKRHLLLDLFLIVLAIAGASLAIWGMAMAAPTIHKGFLIVLVVLPYIAVLSALLQRHCYPNTRVWRAGSISPLDPVPAPMGRKLYVALLTGAQAGVTMLLAFVILSRTWHVGAPRTSFLYDVLHPWSLAPLAESPIVAPQGQAKAGRAIEVSWWVLPAVGFSIFPLIALGWCGTLEANSRRDRVLQQAAPAESRGARVTALLAMLLFWLPLVGLVTGFVACRWNRPTGRWRYRACQVSLAAAVLVHAAIVALVVLLMPKKIAVTIDVVGTPGLAIKGTCVVDGSSQDLTGVVPVKFAFEGQRITYSLASAADAGEFTVKADIDVKTAMPTSSGNPPKNRVRGWAKSRWGNEPQYWIESVDRDGQPAWILAPP